MQLSLELDKHLALARVRMLNDFGKRKNRREACVGSIEKLHPFIQCLRPEKLGKAAMEFGPTRLIVRRRQVLFIETDLREKFRVEPPLNWPD